METKIKDILILGIGNDILTDDGIGPKFVNELEKSNAFPRADFLTAAVGGLEILEMIRDYNKVIIIDAIRTRDGVPGTVYHLTPEDFKETMHLSSFHDITFLAALELGERLKIKIPSQINIIAIEIVEDLVFSNEFSPELQNKIPDIYKEVKESIENYLAV
jgi:hydrogenase maturation protease